MKSLPPIHHGMNRVDLDAALRHLGGNVTIARRTGDVVYTHPLMRERARGNSRRKDAPRSLTKFVLSVIALAGTTAANDSSF